MLCQRFWGRDNCPLGKWYLGVCKKSQLEKVVAGFSPVSHPVKVSNSFSDRQGGQDPSPTGPHPYGQQPYLGSGVGVTILFPSQTVSITGQFGVTWRISTPLVHPSSWLGCTTLSQQPPRLVILLFLDPADGGTTPLALYVSCQKRLLFQSLLNWVNCSQGGRGRVLAPVFSLRPATLARQGWPVSLLLPP